MLVGNLIILENSICKTSTVINLRLVGKGSGGVMGLLSKSRLVWTGLLLAEAISVGSNFEEGSAQITNLVCYSYTREHIAKASLK